jgi:hypothetical protein
VLACGKCWQCSLNKEDKTGKLSVLLALLIGFALSQIIKLNHRVSLGFIIVIPRWLGKMSKVNEIDGGLT